MTAVFVRASLRAASAAAVSCAPWASTACGRNPRSSRAMRSGSAAKKAGPSSAGSSTRQSKRAVAAAAAARGHGSRSLRRPPPTCAPGSAKAAAPHGVRRRRGRAASSTHDPLQRLLELAEDAFGCVRGDRRRRSRAQAATQLVVGEIATHRSGQRVRVAAATTSPLTPSCTTSATPPTAVASTGVPTASASTTVCGKFSQLDERIVASAARKSSTICSRGQGAEKGARGRRCRAPRLAPRAPSARGPRRRSRAGRRLRPRPPAARRSSDFCAVSRPANASVEPS